MLRFAFSFAFSDNYRYALARYGTGRTTSYPYLVATTLSFNLGLLIVVVATFVPFYLAKFRSVAIQVSAAVICFAVCS